jgi:hypothetical protein
MIGSSSLTRFAAALTTVRKADSTFSPVFAETWCGRGRGKDGKGWVGEEARVE